MIWIGTPRIFIGFGVLMFGLFSVVRSDESCDIEIENTLKTLLTPQEAPTMQLQALRQDILRRFADALEQDELNYKRSLSSLARYGGLPGRTANKRNLEALARAGLIHTLPEDEEPEDTSDEDLNEKRSLANLAKNGQLPESGKRALESLSNRNIQQLLDALHNKRNIGSARNFNYNNDNNEFAGKRFIGSLARNGELMMGKRNLASIVRDGNKIQGKRNVAALLRQDSYLNEHANHNTNTEMPQFSSEKRNIASIKAQYPKFKRSIVEGGRVKRESDFYQQNEEYPQPVFQNQNVYDYEELMKELTGFYPNTDKRFLGSVARSGWFKPSSERYVVPEKRHIGALARLGWLPTLRNVRRFNRSGRSTAFEECIDNNRNRETAADGQAEDNAIPQDDTFSLDEKRFLLQPAVDNILLRKLYKMHPRTHSFISRQ